MTYDEQYWSQRYRSGLTGWDAGAITRPLQEYFDQLSTTQLDILIPGAGNAYEAEYLFKKGFENVRVLDISLDPLQNLAKRMPGFPPQNLIHEDFFVHAGQYDLVIEQTFFCALHPSLRAGYAQKMYELLKPAGRLVGVLFDDPLNDDKPPFGGTAKEYEKYFAPWFDFHVFSKCYNSITPRSGRELFINLRRKP